MLVHGNFKLQNTEWDKVHEQPATPFIPKEESAEVLDKVAITLQVLPNATGGDAKNITTIVWQNSSWGTLRS
eukprot:4138286-Ditylum_brightwellii.AAC.1